jgi:hypothetical protein
LSLVVFEYARLWGYCDEQETDDWTGHLVFHMSVVRLPAARAEKEVSNVTTDDDARTCHTCQNIQPDQRQMGSSSNTFPCISGPFTFVINIDPGPQLALR